MRKSFLLTILAMASIACACTSNEDPEEGVDHTIGMDTDYEENSLLSDGTGKKARVIILSGQSNCTGCSITSYLKEQVSEETFSRYGPEVGLADKLTALFPGEEFYIFKFSMSGYSLHYHWLDHTNRGEIYEAQRLFVQKGLDYLSSLHYEISLDAFLWMQGESDTSEYKAKKYYENQKAFMSYLREDFKEYSKEHGLYFIDAGISDSPYCLPGGPEVNEAKKKIGGEDPLNVYFPTIENGLTTMNEPYYEPDLGHYDALSEIKLGELFAEKVAAIYAK